MTTTQAFQPADSCTTMVQVRLAVDAIDDALVALLAERMRFMDAAARIKPKRAAVRDEARKAQVIDRVSALGAARGLPHNLAANLWEQLVEASITYEMTRFEVLHGNDNGAAE